MSGGLRDGGGRFGVSLVGLALAGLLAAQPAYASAPVITDYAGTGAAGTPTPGPAVSSNLSGPVGVVADAHGNLYIADTANNQVEKVTPGGTLSIIAGTGTGGAPTPGPATSSDLRGPEGVGVDSSGNIYIADTNNKQVEQVTPDGTLSIFAGTGAYSGPIPGPAISSPLDYPEDVVVDPSGNVYITIDVDADGNNYVVKVTPGGTLSIFAGNGTNGATTNGPATSTALYGPQGLTVDAGGNVYIADNRQIEQVTPSGTLTVIAGDGTAGAPTYGGAATSSALNNPSGVAVVPGGTVYIADSANNTIDRVGLAAPGAPGQPQLTAGDTTAQLSFRPPVDLGTSPVTGYQVSLDGGATWQTISTTPGAGGALTTTLNGLTDGTTYSVMVRAINGSGPGQNSPSGSVTPEPPTPVSTGIPVVSGAASVGHTLACSPGSWTNNPTRFSYQWYRDGALIPGATAQNYLVARADQGHTITCTVTASNGSTSAQVSSAGMRIPIANESLCPKPSGRLAGTGLGPVWLGLTRSHARRKLPRFADRNSYSDNFCLASGWGIRVGYTSSKLLPSRTRLKGGEIILALTANPYYALHGVKPGMRAAPVARRLKLGQPIELGPNSWYTIPSPLSTGVLKVRHGIIYEIGIVDKGLTSTRAAQARLLVNF